MVCTRSTSIPCTARMNALISSCMQATGQVTHNQPPALLVSMLLACVEARTQHSLVGCCSRSSCLLKHCRLHAASWGYVSVSKGSGCCCRGVCCTECYQCAVLQKSMEHTLLVFGSVRNATSLVQPVARICSSFSFGSGSMCRRMFGNSVGSRRHTMMAQLL